MPSSAVNGIYDRRSADIHRTVQFSGGDNSGRWVVVLTAVAVKRCREKSVQASGSSERKRPYDVGDRAPVPALRPEGRRPAELYRRRAGRVPAVSQAAAGRGPRPARRPCAALSVGVRTDDRRPGSAAD